MKTNSLLRIPTFLGIFGFLVLIINAASTTAACGVDGQVAKGNEKETWGTRLNERAADFTLLDQNGNEVSLHDFKGKVILLDISTMWCPPCKRESKDAEELYQKYKDEDFVMLVVLIENPHRRPVTNADSGIWADTYKLTFPVMADVRQEVWRAYNEEYSIPLNLVIDRDLTIRYKKTGYFKDAIEAKIREALGE